MERLIAKMGINFKNGPTPHRGAGPNPANTRRYAFSAVAFLAALAVGLLFLLPGGLLQAQEASMKTFDYTENGTDPVATFTAEDPEEASPIVWSLLASDDDDAQDIPGEGNNDGDDGADDVLTSDGEDGDLFKISAAGVLEFEAKPNYESPADNGNNNEYKVVVQASDGTEMNWFKVTVMVMDEEEDGSVKLQPTGQAATTLLQPQVRVGITAHSLADPDGRQADPPPTYQWYRTSSRTAMGTEIDGANAAAYEPQAKAGDSDVGMYLRVVATYTDGRGSNKTATAVSEYVTIGIISNNTPPVFPAETDTRAVLEETPKGTLIGLPVSATDADSADRLTYWLSGTDGSLFDIDAMTGQLKVETKLNYEGITTSGDDIDRCVAANACSVIVEVADSSFGSVETGTATIAVTITVTNVDEKPISFTGEKTIEHPEGTTALDTDLSNGDTANPATYTATDPEGGAVTFTLSGDDAEDFNLTGDTPGTRTLVFEEEPDFENPEDYNGDNVYEVTVVASDGVNDATRDVTVKVTNDQEDGELEVMPAQPRVGVQLTAELTDKDGVVSGPTWEWRKLSVPGACPIAGDTQWEPTPDTTLIKDATSDTYTPESDDNGACLRVKAEYVDGFYDTATDTPDMMFDKTLASVLPAKVQGSSTNMPPRFEEGARAMRYVPENVLEVTEAADEPNVGLLVEAKDPGDTLSYTLSGTDAGAFEIDLDTGQIMVKDDAKLDHEAKPMHTVTVTATDSHNASATITVTIHVTDVDEAPAPDDSEYIKTANYVENETRSVLTLTAEDPEEAEPVVWSLLESAATNQDIPGVGDDGGTADDVDSPDIAHRAMFRISQEGVLTFKEKPDFEDSNPTGADKEYKVVVQASDGATMDTLSWFKVTVNVTDKEEEGSVKLSPTNQYTAVDNPYPTLLQPQVEVDITAHSLMDPDGSGENTRTTRIIPAGITTTYQWYRTSSRMADGTKIKITGADATGPTYTPQATAGNSDVGMYLRVVATYNDGRDDGKTAEAVSEYVTIAQNADNTAPKFPAARAARAVLEETPKGTPIVPPVSATDADSADRLTYWLSEGTDVGKFDIDPRTGQLKVKDKLNYMGDTPTETGRECAANSCSVTVMVADSSGTTTTAQTPAGTDMIMVTITVTNVDEEPKFDTMTASLNVTTIDQVENVTELMSSDDSPFTYAATDPEGGTVTFTLLGDDALKLTSDDGLEFKEKPDFETPVDDENGDNVYEVMVVASDGVNDAMLDVTVKVTNVEEAGEIQVMPVQPRVGVELTAELDDSDGVVSGPTWQWYKRMTTAQDALCSTINDWEATDSDVIEDATSENYTPVSKDDGYCLRVKAEYVDGFYDVDAGTDDIMFDKTMASVLPAKVQGSSTNIPPRFEEGARAMRYVPEDVGAENVGLPVVAKDPGDTLGYRLGGADAASFEILQDDPGTTDVNEDGQIRVKEDAELDHEDQPTHTVTVTATDPHNASADITVTIHVTDVDEAPMIMVDDGSEINQAPRFLRSTEVRNVAENTPLGTPIGDPVTATDGDDDTLTYALSGSDMSHFDLDPDTGQLMTKSALDYETKNSYSVTVTVSDGNGGSDTVAVTINVTDVDDPVTPPDVTLFDRYDVDDSGEIERSEAIGAINDYLFGQGDDAITRDEVIEIINLYLFG